MIIHMTSEKIIERNRKNSAVNRTKALDRYYKNPAICNYCKEIIIVKDGEQPGLVKRKKYCNHSCCAKALNKTFPKRLPEGKCKSCDTAIRKKLTFCKNCRKLNKTRTLNQTIGDICKRKDAGRFSPIRYHARKIYEELNLIKKCHICGYDKHVEICHIIPIRDFSQDISISIINSKDNLIPLCPNCHWEFDHGLLNISTLRTRT